MVRTGRTVGAIVKGDLIFYDISKNDGRNRYRDIDHVAIYVGDGYIIDASTSHNMVVKRSSTNAQSDIVLKSRPSVSL